MDPTNSKILEEIINSKKELRNIVQASEVNILLKIESLNDKIKQLEKQNTALQNRVELLERSTKRNNIVIFGIKQLLPNISAEVICDKLNTLLNTNIGPEHINNIYSLGRSENAPVKVEFLSNLTKTQILKNCFKLKNTKLIVSHDLTTTQRETNNTLRNYLKKVKPTANRSYIKGERLYIDNTILTVKDILEIENEENQEISTNSAPETPSRNIQGTIESYTYLTNREEEKRRHSGNEKENIEETSEPGESSKTPQQNKNNSKTISVNKTAPVGVLMTRSRSAFPIRKK